MEESRKHLGLAQAPESHRLRWNRHREEDARLGTQGLLVIRCSEEETEQGTWGYLSAGTWCWQLAAWGHSEREPEPPGSSSPRGGARTETPETGVA